MEFAFVLEMKNSAIRPIVFYDEVERCTYVPVLSYGKKYEYFKIFWDEALLEAGDPDMLEACGYKNFEDYKAKTKKVWEE